jgi:bleomycin hydrolase
MYEIYTLMVKFMGEPPGEFDWCFHQVGDTFEGIRERGTFQAVRGLTPMKFYNEYVAPEMHLEDKIVLRHDPRARSEYYRTYQVKHFGSMVGGQPETVLNVPWDVLSRTAAKAVMAGDQLWFSADVQKSMSYEHGILSTEAFDYESLLDTKFMDDKALALDMRMSAPTHAMVLVGVDVEENDPDRVKKWKVENSWGESSGGEDPGYFLMTQDWFTKYGYEVVVDIKHVDSEVREAYLKYEFDPIYLPYNDAFGAVAKRNLKAPPCQKHL